MIRPAVLLLALLLSLFLHLPGCSSGSDSPGGGDSDPGSQPFGLPGRETVTTLTFPSAGGTPSDLNRVDAFPALTFASPVFLASPPDGTNRICVVEQAGRIRIFPNSSSVAAAGTFLDIQSLVLSGGEEGLLGMAFDPNYRTNGRFYIYHSAASPRRSVIARYRVSAGDPDQADPASRTVLLEVNQPYSNHKAGMMAFGADGLLYIALGDGGSGGDPLNHGQDLTTLLGSLLRIQPEANGAYSIPSDNPFVSRGGGVRGEIWAYGLRNPWRFSFDRQRGDLWVGDVGQGSREEVSVATRGANLGWRVYEGTVPFQNPSGLPASSFTPPVIDYPRSLGNAVIGGYVYRGSLLTTLRGAYLYGDNGSGRIWALTHEDFTVTSNRQVASVSGLSSFGEDEGGEIYAVSLGGKVYRFTEAQPAPTTFPAHLSQTGIFSDTARLVPSRGVIEFAIRHEHWVDGARMRRWIALPGSSPIVFHPTGAWTFPKGSVLVKHFEIELRPGDPASVDRLETRVLIHEEAGWAGYTYRWNSAGTDASLLSDAETETLIIQEAGGPRTQDWYYPSRNDCFRCHTVAAGEVLGVRTRQLNRDFDYAAATDNQLRAWNHIHLFTSDIGSPSSLGALAAFQDENESVEDRVRAYLEVNCAHCHLPGGPAPGDMDLRLDTAQGSMSLIGARPTSGDLGLPDAFRVKAGVKEASVLWERTRRRDAVRMPPLASGVADAEAVDLIAEWIDGLNP